MKKLIYFAALLVFTLTGCNNQQDDPSANTMASFSVQQKTTLNKSTTKTKTVINPFNKNISFTKILIGISQISIEQKSESSGTKSEHQISFQGPFIFDVLNKTSEPAIAPVPVDPGKYSELKFKVDHVLPGGNSILIAGTYSYNNISFDFEFTTDITQEFEVNNENGLQINEGDIKQFILYFDIPSLFEGIDITKLTFDADNVVRINLSKNSEVAKMINANMDNALDLDLENDD